MWHWFFFFQAEDGIRDLVRSRGLGDVYKRQVLAHDRRGDRLAALQVLQVHLADPLRIGRARRRRKAVLRVAGDDAVVAAGRALRGVYEHAPAHLAAGGRAGRCLLFTPGAAGERLGEASVGAASLKKKTPHMSM